MTDDPLDYLADSTTVTVDQTTVTVDLQFIPQVSGNVTVSQDFKTRISASEDWKTSIS